MLYYKFLRLESIYYFCEIDYVFKTEQWKDVVGYEGLYQISDLGRVKSLKRKRNNKCKNHSRKLIIERILKQSIMKYYPCVGLHKHKINKITKVHIISSMAFLNHTPCGHKLVVNHIDINKLNNKLNNLELTTARINSNRAHLKSTSKYVGVCWEKSSKKWVARIHFNKKRKTIGRFLNEIDASNAYQKALLAIL